MIARIARVVAYASSLGAGAVTVLDLLDWSARRAANGGAIFETLRLELLGSFPQVLFRPVRGISGREAALLSIVAGLLAWRRTRYPMLAAVAAAAGGWAVAMACAAAYALDPSLGLCAPFAALAAAFALARRRSWSVPAMLVVTFGIGIGFFLAQNAVLLAGPGRSIASPLYGFVPPAVLAVSIAWWMSRSEAELPGRTLRRMARFWGLCAACLSITFSVVLEALCLRARSPEPPAERMVDEFAYDVRIAGEPAALVWTDRARIQVLEDVYGERRERRALDDPSRVERIWPGHDGDFYVQNGWDILWWSPAPDGQPIPPRPTARLRAPAWVGETMTGSAAAFAEDPVTKRYLIFSEWLSHYALVERDTGTVVAKGILSDAISPWPYTTVDAARRVAFISTSMDDGHLYEFDLDAERVVRQAPDLYLYATVIDPSAGLLWGTRPFTGELIAVDTRTLEIRHRVPVAPTIRGLQRDSDSGDLFTCSMMFGDVFRVDRRTLAASKVGWCGRLCRNLFVDARRRTLWVATADGICGIPLREEAVRAVENGAPS